MSWGDHEHDEIRKRLGTDNRKKEDSAKQLSGARGGSNWRRYRFETKSIEDYRPIVFNHKYPWWCSGFSSDSAIIVAYLPTNEDLKKYWDDAFNIDFTEHDKIEFSGRFPKPQYFQE